MPALAPCIAAALAAGAKGAFLSGAGSSIMALTSGRKGDIYGQADRERRDIEVARAMQVRDGTTRFHNGEEQCSQKSRTGPRVLHRYDLPVSRDRSNQPITPC